MLVSVSENTRQANKTRDYSNFNMHVYSRIGKNHPMHGRTGENHPRSIKIMQYDKQTHKLIKIWDSAMDIERELGIKNGNIITCCKWYACGEDLEEWYKTHKNHPYKSTGGFIFRYYTDEEQD